jgi:hypothetical protein
LHDCTDRRERDAFDDILASAGIPLLHVRWQRSYAARALAEQIAIKLGIVQTAEAARPPLAPPPAPIAAAPLLVATPPTPMRRACSQRQAELRNIAKFCAHCGCEATSSGTLPQLI